MPQPHLRVVPYCQGSLEPFSGRRFGFGCARVGIFKNSLIQRYRLSSRTMTMHSVLAESAETITASLSARHD